MRAIARSGSRSWWSTDLIERPILVREDGKAVIGRSDDALSSVLQC